MNILIAINNNYYKPAKVMLTSLCENNQFETHTVYLLYSNLDKDKIDDIQKRLSKYKGEVIPLFVSDKNFDSLPVSHHFSIETYYRFLMQTMVPQSLDRILWLDADMIIKGSLKEFYYQDLSGNYIAVCKSINKNPEELINKLCLPKDTVYFNAGIILFNLDKIRAEIDPKVYFDYARDNAEKITWLDQDILNAIFAEKKKVWDYHKYNYQHFSDALFDEHEKKLIDKDTVVLHYIGSVKPWHFKYNSYTLKYYRRYAKKCDSLFENMKFRCLHSLYALKRGMLYFFELMENCHCI